MDQLELAPDVDGTGLDWAQSEGVWPQLHSARFTFHGTISHTSSCFPVI